MEHGAMDRGAPALVVGVDARCLRGGLDRLAGVGVHVREILTRLLAAGFEEEPPLRIVPFTGSRWRSRALEALSPDGGGRLPVAATRLPGRALEALWRRFPWPPLESFIGRCDLLHGPDYFLPPHRARRRICTVHDLSVLRHPSFSTDGYRRRFERELPSFRQEGTRFIAVSEFTRKEMRELLGVPPERVKVIPNGVDSRFKPCRGPEDRERLAGFRRARSLPDRFLLGVGSIQPRKNLLNLLRALRILEDRSGRKEALVLCGNDEWLSRPIRAEAARLATPVRFLSLPRKEMPLLYAASTALVYPSLYEGFGLPPLEAMACGTPVAVSGIEAHREVVAGAGLYFPPEDPAAIASCLERLLDDRELRAGLAEAGPARAAPFTWEGAAAVTRAAYLEAIAE